ncbi:hypothetical protein Bca4012_076419 [Brassica carinata]|uniref:BnaCnng39280D protein n=1 Tax=Brassica napus TaxID=3708 RepID=A0A078JCB1_BRANA|nr:BnaCnng39280D [Brassica napus]
MSSFAVFGAQSAGPHATFYDLRLCRSTQVVVGRLLCFWDSGNINKNGEFMGSTILFLDEKMNMYVHLLF